MTDLPRVDEESASAAGGFLSASSVLDAALFLTDEDGRRVATGFVVTVPFSRSIGGREYLHTYVVTARHCTSGKNGYPHKLTAQCSWMGDVGIQSADLDPGHWSTIKLDELCQDDEWVDEVWIDVAVQRLNTGLYSDEAVGRSLRAIRSDQFLPFRRDLYSDVAPIGMPTLTVGLLQFVPGDPMRLEPMAHFGRLAMVPVGTVEGSWGQMAAYLVESSASQGMSGAPVFAQLENGEYRLLGMHVGHFQEQQEPHIAKPNHEGQLLQARDDQHANVQSFRMHSQVVLVAPAYKVFQILNAQPVRDSQEQVEAAVQKGGWRFLDSSYRQRAGVCRPEARYINLKEYEASHPYDRHFLIFRPTNEQWPSERRSDEGFESWSELDVEVLGTVDAVVDTLRRSIGMASPVRSSSDGILLHMRDEGFDVTLYLDDSKNVEALEVRLRGAGDRIGVYDLARDLSGSVQDVRRD
ncbi:trypsin-like serine peptidase [Arthrobacter citreus]|uniref:hypothetical protein n=1 Tax=Arthrobacter citreus TaxID=1670 RepID=UPI0036DBB230